MSSSKSWLSVRWTNCFGMTHFAFRFPEDPSALFLNEEDHENAISVVRNRFVRISFVSVGISFPKNLSLHFGVRNYCCADHECFKNVS